MVDLFDMRKAQKNVHVCLKANIPEFWKLMLDAVHCANKVSILNKK